MRTIKVLAVVAAMCWAAGALAASPKSYTIDHEIKFEPGDPKWTARLRNIAAVGDLVDYEYVTSPLAVTREEQGGYRLLAISNGKGGIEVADRPGAPMHGKPLVWAMQPVAVTR